MDGLSESVLERARIVMEKLPNSFSPEEHALFQDATDEGRTQYVEPLDRGSAVADYPAVIVQRAGFAHAGGTHGLHATRVDFWTARYAVCMCVLDASEIGFAERVERWLYQGFVDCEREDTALSLPAVGSDENSGMELCVLDGGPVEFIEQEEDDDGKRFWYRGIVVELTCQEIKG